MNNDAMITERLNNSLVLVTKWTLAYVSTKQPVLFSEGYPYGPTKTVSGFYNVELMHQYETRDEAIAGLADYERMFGVTQSERVGVCQIQILASPVEDIDPDDIELARINEALSKLNKSDAALICRRLGL